jgi:hypothetical protein
MSVQHQPQCIRAVVLSLCLLLGVIGCAVERGKVYVKDGVRYGVTSGQIWRGNWWNYYERGVSYAAGEFWDEAMADFQAALAQYHQDERRARTYGLHLIDYFPHRELGVVYYRLARYPEAIRELETSLSTVETAKTKFYLNRARKAFLEQTRGDTTPPRIVLESPADGFLTNRFAVIVRGQAEDDTYVAALTINGQPLFVELAAPLLPFSQEVALHDGSNTIDVVAVDLLGHATRQRLSVYADRQGPLVSLEKVELVGQPPQQYARIQGLLSDQSRVRRFVLAGQHIPPQSATEWEFRTEVPVAPGTMAIPFEAEDMAGNTTRGAIALEADTPKPQRIREGKLALSDLPRLAWATPILSDLATFRLAPLRMAQSRVGNPPVIKLTSLTDRETVSTDTVYLEGEVVGERAITAFAINGESLWRRPTRQLFFGRKFPLHEGENTFHLEVVDDMGHTGRRDIVVTRDIPRARQLGLRLRVSNVPFQKKGQASVLSEAVYDNLLEAFVAHKRFDFVERQQLEAVLQELKLSQTELIDPATAAKIGKLAAAEGVLVGTVLETPHALDVYARLVDVETSVILAAEDVYGEDLSLPTVKALMEGLSWKLRRHFPLVEGAIIEKTGQNLLVDLTKGHGVQRYMKLIVFREGEERQHPRSGKMLQKPHAVLGEARITVVANDLSEAVLLRTEQTGDVRELDRVITK